MADDTPDVEKAAGDASDDAIDEDTVDTRAHFHMMTEQQGKFIPEDGKTPGRLLLCEFVDNAIYAMLRSAILVKNGGAFPEMKPIEIHIFYGKAEEDERLPEHIAILDFGPGMDKTALQGWAELAKPASERNRDDRGSQLLDAENASLGTLLPFQADGRLGIFGKGSKSAGFYYGTQVRAITKPSDDERTSELHLDKAQMAQASSTGGDWQKAVIKRRGQGARARDKLRLESERQCAPLLDLYERADQSPSYSLFVISDLHEQPKQELRLGAFLTTVCELRDTYSVYCDTMADAFKQLAERREAPSPPSLRFKYGPLDVKVTHWNRPRSASRAKDSAAWETRTFSLRPDREDSLNIEEEIQQEIDELDEDVAEALDSQLGLAAAYARSPLHAIELAAPEVFCFRFQSPKLREDDGMGRVEGRVLYLPFVDGEEQHTKVQMHLTSRAFCFWKGRQMQYAVSPLLPFMQKAITADNRGYEKRTVLLLALGSVKKVDETKFRLSGDLNSIIEEKGSSAVGMDNFEIFRAGQGWARANNPTNSYRKWLEDVHLKFDLQVVLRQPKGEPGDLCFEELEYGGTIKYLAGDRVKLKGPKMAAPFEEAGGQKVVAARLVHFSAPPRALVGATGEVACPTCTVVYVRLPPRLYGDERLECQPSALMSKEHHVVTAEVMKEVEKEPSKMFVSFVVPKSVRRADEGTSESANASPSAVGAAPGPSHSAPAPRLGAEKQPFVLCAGESLPRVCVRALNEKQQLVNEWKVGGVNRLRIRQSVHFQAAGLDSYMALAEMEETTEGKASSVVDINEKEHTGIFLSTDKLPLKEAGSYELRFELLLQHDAQSGSAGPAPLCEKSLYVSVVPGTVQRLGCKCLTDPVVLGQALRIEVSFLDASNNCCFIEKKELLRMQEMQLKEDIEFAISQDESLHLTSKEMHLTKGSGGAVAADKLRSVVLNIGVKVEAEEGSGGEADGHGKSKKKVVGLQPSDQARKAARFSRTTGTTCQIKVQLADLSGRTKALESEPLALKVFSGGPLTFEETKPWLQQPGATYENREVLPKLTLRLADAFGALLGNQGRKVRIRTEPSCDGIDGAAANLDAQGVAKFAQLRPMMDVDKLPTTIIVHVDPPDGEVVAKPFTREVRLVPSTRPHRAELLDARVVAGASELVERLDHLGSGGNGGGNGGAQVYSLRAVAGSRVDWLRARVLTEAEEDVHLPSLEVEKQGISLPLSEKKRFNESGALPVLVVPEKCTEEALTVMFSFSNGTERVCAELRVYALPAAPAKWVFTHPSGAALSADAQRRRGRSGTHVGIDVENGQPLAEILSVRLVDNYANVVNPASVCEGDAAELHPVIRVEGGVQEAGVAPMLALEGKRHSEFELDVEFRSERQRMEYALTGRTRLGGGRALSLRGTCRTLSLRVEDRLERFGAASVQLNLLAGEPRMLRLSEDDAAKLSEELHTRKHFDALRFVVTDREGNRVDVDTLDTARALVVKNPQFDAKVVVGGGAMTKRSGDRGEWELRDVSFTATHTLGDGGAAATPAPPIEHTLFCEGAQATLKSEHYKLKCAPFKLRTQPSNLFVVGIGAVIEQEQRLEAGSRLLEFKVWAVMEDGSKTPAAEFGTALDVLLRTPKGRKISLKRDKSLYGLDAHIVKDKQLVEVGKYVVEARYTEVRPQVEKLLRACRCETLVQRTLKAFEVRAGPPAKLVAAHRLAEAVQVNNTDRLQVLGELKLCLHDAYGNETGAAGAACLAGGAVALVLERVRGDERDADGGAFASGGNSTAPSVDEQRSAPCRVALSGSEGQLTLGPLLLKQGTGQGDCVMKLRFALEPSTALAMPAPITVTFTDMHGRNAVQRQRQKELERQQQAQRDEACRRKEALQSACDELDAADAEEKQRHVEIFKACEALKFQLKQCIDSCAQFTGWAREQAQFTGRGLLVRQSNDMLASWLMQLLPWDTSRGLTARDQVAALTRAAELLRKTHDDCGLGCTQQTPQPAAQHLSRTATSLRAALPFFQCVVHSLNALAGQLNKYHFGPKLPPNPTRERVLRMFQHPDVLGEVARLVSVRFVGVELTHKLAAVLSDTLGARLLQTIVTRSVGTLMEFRKSAQRQGLLKQSYWAIASMQKRGSNQRLPMDPPPGKLLAFARDFVVPSKVLTDDEADTLLGQLFGDTVVVQDEETAFALMFAARGRRLGKIVALDGFRALAMGMVDDHGEQVGPQLAKLNAHFGVSARNIPAISAEQAQGAAASESPAPLAQLLDALCQRPAPAFFQREFDWQQRASCLEEKRIALRNKVALCRQQVAEVAQIEAASQANGPTQLIASGAEALTQQRASSRRRTCDGSSSSQGERSTRQRRS